MKCKLCSDYVGVACVNGSCPNALLYDEPQLYADIYGTYKETKCKDCSYNEQCKDCALPYMDETIGNEVECRKLHGLEAENHTS